MDVLQPDQTDGAFHLRRNVDGDDHPDSGHNPYAAASAGRFPCPGSQSHDIFRPVAGIDKMRLKSGVQTQLGTKGKQSGFLVQTEQIFLPKISQLNGSTACHRMIPAEHGNQVILRKGRYSRSASSKLPRLVKASAQRPSRSMVYRSCCSHSATSSVTCG